VSALAEYRAAVAQKRLRFAPRGLAELPALSPAMKPHQRHGVEFALRAGTAALFYDTGLGKTLCALEWGRVVAEHTGKPVLMLAPLAVGAQHQAEAEKFGIEARAIREPHEVAGPIVITNYERLAKFEDLIGAQTFGGIILDESSILKSFTGVTTRALIETFARTPFRLACTATPAPNDHTELGTHAEFLGVMRRQEMLVRWFIHDSADTGTWRLKGHATDDFWSWVASWARAIERPSDLGFSDDGYALPRLDVRDHAVASDVSSGAGVERDGQSQLFRMPENSATSIHREKRLTLAARADVATRIIAAEPEEPFVVWCDTDAEEEAITSRVPEAVAVRGSMTPEVKERRIVAFGRGETRILVSKASICGYGLNWQHCARQIFVGLSFSYENYYQAIRRCWRFGQARPVVVHVIGADTERAIRAVVARKEGDHAAMKTAMKAAMARATVSHSPIDDYSAANAAPLPRWLTA
jgi:hypothetical protein